MSTDCPISEDDAMTSRATVKRRTISMSKGRQTSTLSAIATDAACHVSERAGGLRNTTGAVALQYDAEIMFSPAVDVAPNATSDSEDIIEITSGRHVGAKYRCVHASRSDWNTLARVRRVAKSGGHSEQS